MLSESFTPRARFRDGKTGIPGNFARRSEMGSVEMATSGPIQTFQHWHLTNREARIVELVANGSSSKEVAQVLAISPSTVETHLESAKLKLGARTRPNLIARAIASGIVGVCRDGSVDQHPSANEHGRKIGPLHG
jgi:DNA-binding CsgD family transcriptional regulator